MAMTKGANRVASDEERAAKELEQDDVPSDRGTGPDSVERVEREAWEEAELKGRAKKCAFGRFSYLNTLPDGKQVPSFVTVHVMTVRRTKAHFPENKERKLAWMPPLEAASLVNEPELKSLLRCVEQQALS